MARKQNVKLWFDYNCLFVILLLTAFGIVMIYSTTAYTDSISRAINGTRGLTTAQKQGLITVGALVFLLVVAKIDYHLYMIPWVSVLIFLGACGLCALTLLRGKSENGAQRWLTIGGLSLQTAEPAKIALILAIASLTNKMYSKTKTWLYILICGVIAVLPFYLVASENLSSGVIIGVIAYMMVYSASDKKIIFPLMAVLAVIAVIVGWRTGFLQEHALKSYQVTRIEAWLHPENDKSGKGFQILQGLYTVGSGGLFGKGLGASISKVILPEAQNDMIFSIICEELGLCGAMMVIALYLILIWRLMTIANSAPDLCGCLIATGVMVHIGLQAVLNICVVTNLIVNTGISLPFISNGGSSIFFIMIEMGIVLNVSSQIRVVDTKEG